LHQALNSRDLNKSESKYLYLSRFQWSQTELVCKWWTKCCGSRSISRNAKVSRGAGSLSHKKEVFHSLQKNLRMVTSSAGVVKLQQLLRQRVAGVNENQ